MIAAATQHGHSKLTAKSSHLCSLASNSSKTLRPVGNGSSKIEGGSSRGSVVKCLITLNNSNTDFQTESQAAHQIYTSGTFGWVQRKHSGSRKSCGFGSTRSRQRHVAFAVWRTESRWTSGLPGIPGNRPDEIRQIRTNSRKVLSEETNRSIQKSGPKKT